MFYLIKWKSHTKMTDSWVNDYILEAQAPILLKKYKKYKNIN